MLDLSAAELGSVQNVFGIVEIRGSGKSGFSALKGGLG